MPDLDTLQAEITVANGSPRKAPETVQMYVGDCTAGIVRPATHENNNVAFTLTKKMLMFYNQNMDFFKPEEYT